MTPYLKHHYWYFTKAVTPEKCQDIIQAASKKTPRAGTTRKPQSAQGRQSTISWIADPKIYELLNPFIHKANKNAGWNFQWSWNETSQFTVYNKGDFYQWHMDSSAPMSSPVNHPYHNKIRKLSLTLQLTDPSQYKGGDFQFRWLNSDAQRETVTVKDAKDLGTIIIFPSFLFHRVTRITKGARRSLVNWSLGDSFK
jgi:PKHD-type hydroxylase